MFRQLPLCHQWSLLCVRRLIHLFPPAFQKEENSWRVNPHFHFVAEKCPFETDAGLAAVVAAAADVGLPEDADQEPVAVAVAAAAVGDSAADVDLGFAAELDEDWAAVQDEDLAVGQDPDLAAVEADLGVAAAGVD